MNVASRSTFGIKPDCVYSATPHDSLRPFAEGIAECLFCGIGTKERAIAYLEYIGGDVLIERGTVAVNIAEIVVEILDYFIFENDIGDGICEYACNLLGKREHGVVTKHRFPEIVEIFDRTIGGDDGDYQGNFAALLFGGKHIIQGRGLGRIIDIKPDGMFVVVVEDMDFGIIEEHLFQFADIGNPGRSELCACRKTSSFLFAVVNDRAGFPFKSSPFPRR